MGVVADLVNERIGSFVDRARLVGGYYDSAESGLQTQVNVAKRFKSLERSLHHWEIPQTRECRRTRGTVLRH
jgi:hypothetical protein